jgi:subtilase family serine protease
MTVRAARHGRLKAVVRVRNTGNRALHDVRTRIVDDGRVVDSVVLATVRPGTTRTVTSTWRPDRRTVHHVAARVDPRDRITESNERDNRQSRAFRR